MNVIFMFMLICLVVHCNTAMPRGTCDFSNNVVQNCEAVIESPLDLISTELQNVTLELSCSPGVHCIVISNVDHVDIYNTNITCHEEAQGIGLGRGSLYLDKVNFDSCAGAITFSSGSNLRILNSNFENNIGRAINVYCASSVSIKESSFINNSNGAGVGNEGGGAVRIVNTTMIDITTSKFIRNTAHFSDDEVQGGACHIRNTFRLSISHSTFANNTVLGYGKGAGVYISNAFTLLTNVTFVGNSAATGYFSEGGGVALYDSNCEIVECSFRENKADKGGMLFANGVNSGIIKSSNAETNIADDVWCHNADFLMDHSSIANIPNIIQSLGCQVCLLS